jgi:coenzyme PQQ precursor peptide PqqA
MKNPATISAIQNKRHIESIRSFLAMSNPPRGESSMAWKTPRIVEMALGMEINTYACAGL